ncbi:MAG: beta strand repeat-containing protein [Phycisphaerales bacterium]
MHSNLCRPRLLIALCGLAAGAASTRADTWDNSAGSALWSTATNWLDNTEPGISDFVTFPNTIPGGQSTITLSSGEFALSLTFLNSYTLSGGNIQLGNGSIALGGWSPTINSVIAGSGPITVSNGGTLNLFGQNSFTGGISINGTSTTVVIRSNTGLGFNTAPVNLNGGRLRLNGSINPTFIVSRVITPGAAGGTIDLQDNVLLDLFAGLGANANPLSFTGSGTVELNNGSARTGATTVNAVLLRLNSPTGLGTPGAATLTNGAVLEISNGSGVFAGTVNAFAGTTIRGGAGTHTFNGSANVFGNVTLNGGLAAADTLILGSGGISAWNNGSGAVTTIDIGTVHLNSGNAYAGDWAINGTLQVNHSDGVGVGTNPMIVNPGGVLRLNAPSLIRAVTVNSASLQLSQDVTLDADVILNSAQFAGAGRVLSLDDSMMTVDTSNVVAASCLIGSSPTSIAGATLSGPSLWNMTSNCVVGYAGQGALLAQTGADIFSALTHIGSLPGSMGTATIDGNGTIWTNTGFLGIGYSGTGTLNIQNHGTVNTSSTFIGADPGSHGTVNVDGTGSLFISASPVIGEHGVGAMTISNGGRMTGSAGFVGRMPDGAGAVTVIGANSLWTCSSTLAVGGSGDGTLDIFAGGRVTSTDCVVGQSAGSGGLVTVSGPDATLQCDSLTVGFQGEGTLRVMSGGAVTTQGAGSIGSASTTNGSIADVIGTGSVWDVGGNLEVGSAGNGLLRIQQSGEAAVGGNVLLGLLVGSNGSGVVMGEGSALNTTGSLIVGYRSGSGDLTIQDGADVTCSQASIGNSSGTGIAFVNGAGSTWNISGALGLGFNGSGSLGITGGGSVSCLGASLGSGAGSSGSLTISGALSRFTCGVFGVAMDSGGTSTLNLLGGIVDIHGDIADAGAGVSTFILDGATLDMHSFAIGGGAAPIDSVQFRSGTLKNVAQINSGAGLSKTGTGTLFLNTPNTYTGGTTISQGTLFVVNLSGSATGPGMVGVAAAGTLAGPGRVGGPVRNEGAVAPSGFVGSSIGTLTVQNTFTQLPGGTLEIQIGSAVASDRIAVSGSASLAGTLNVTLLAGVVPAAGDMFTVLTAAGVAGSFGTVNLPALPEGSTWQVDYLTNAVRLAVVSDSCPSDFNNDGNVDPDDLGDYINCFFGTPPCAQADFNSDGNIDPDDLGDFINQFFGPPC